MFKSIPTSTLTPEKFYEINCFIRAERQQQENNKSPRWSELVSEYVCERERGIERAIYLCDHTHLVPNKQIPF